jgi:RNA polymerase sigma-70 factor (ECF subfamily)
LDALLRRYLDPMKSHLVVAMRLESNRADDYLQGFLQSQVLERELLARAQQERGRFRSFLLIALDRYVYNRLRAERSEANRGAAAGAVPIEQAETIADHAPTPPENFNRAWAQNVLKEAVQRMEAHCIGLGRNDVWTMFQARVLAPAFEGAKARSYAQLVEELGLPSPAQAGNVLITAKRMFLRCLRSVIAEYERDEEQIDVEIAELRRIIS